jgi:hypothetical protein
MLTKAILLSSYFLFSEGMGFLDGKARKWLEAAL